MTDRAVMHHFCTRFPAFTMLTALILAAASLSQAGDEVTNSASDHILQAEIALHDDDYLEAAAEYRTAAELSEDAEIARQATRLAFDLGFNDDALRAAKRWHDLDPDSDEALIHLAQLQLRVGDMRDARRNFTALIERGKPPADKRLFTLMAFISQEDSKRADELMRSLAKPYEDSALAQYAVAAVAMQADDLDFAMERSKVAIELDPEWLKARLLYARTLLLSGEADEAIDYTARIVGDDPDPSPDARMELALMYMSAGRDDDALSQVNQV
ncbi:MAG: tetratricopeptide repeat protein, partial [Woeseiaceae bacterium]|nr:tetratricopeptide repeat protein [Woeseiaceae bacterium]